MHTWGVDVYHRRPIDLTLEIGLTEEANKFGGVLEYRDEEDSGGAAHTLCLTYEFLNEQEASLAIDALKLIGGDKIKIEGPYPYG